MIYKKSWKYILYKDESSYCTDFSYYRPKAIKDFSNVKVGDIGGYLRYFNNLSQKGNCWIYDYALVNENAKVSENAQVSENAIIFGNALVCGNARIFGYAMVYDNALVTDNTIVRDNAKVYGNARVSGNAYICKDKLILK